VSFESGFENHNWRGTDVRWQSVPMLQALDCKEMNEERSVSTKWVIPAV